MPTPQAVPAAHRQSVRVPEILRTFLPEIIGTLRTPNEAKREVEEVLRGWGEYFRKSLCTKSFHDVWEYDANTRLARMARRWNQRQRLGRWSDHERRGLRLGNPPSPMYPTRAGWTAHDAVGWTPSESRMP
ncbi:MAG: group II intron maturase-specific domain-containing protein [Thermoplasmata archaeon]